MMVAWQFRPFSALPPRSTGGPGQMRGRPAGRGRQLERFSAVTVSHTPLLQASERHGNRGSS
jgi:hypothetical protein